MINEHVLSICCAPSPVLNAFVLTHLVLTVALRVKYLYCPIRQRWKLRPRNGKTRAKVLGGYVAETGLEPWLTDSTRTSIRCLSRPPCSVLS